jgi:hypothetical protein
MQVKILLALVTVTSMFWWFSAWAGRKVPAFQVQKYPGAVPVVALPKSTAPILSPSPTASVSAVPSPSGSAEARAVVPRSIPGAAGSKILAPSPVSPLPSLAAGRPLAPKAIAPIPIPSTQPVAPSPVVLRARSLPIDPVTNQILDALMSAVISQESNGDSQVQHPVSKAMGLGQVLPSNIPAWTRETFGQELTEQQFRSSPDAQMYVIRQKLFQYYGQAIAASGGNLHLAVRRVGAQWYSGQSDLYDSTKPVATGPSIQDYTQQVLGRFQNYYPQNLLVRY